MRLIASCARPRRNLCSAPLFFLLGQPSHGSLLWRVLGWFSGPKIRVILHTGCPGCTNLAAQEKNGRLRAVRLDTANGWSIVPFWISGRYSKFVYISQPPRRTPSCGVVFWRFWEACEAHSIGLGHYRHNVYGITLKPQVSMNFSYLRS